MTRPPRGKNSHPDYVALVARIPKHIRAEFQKLLIDAESDTNTVIERLVRGLLSGAVSLEYLPEAVAPDNLAEAPASRSAPAPRRSEDDQPPPRSAAPVDLSDILEKLGMTQKDLAELLGISRPSLSRYVRGERPAPPDVVDRARALLKDREA